MYGDNSGMAGKVVLITGGSKGIGAGCAMAFVAAGARVVICARGIQAGQALASKLTAAGPGICHFEPCDVSKAEDIRRVVDQTVELGGRLDCLINNAGFSPPPGAIDDFSLEAFWEVLRTNLISYFLACKQALPHLRKTRGNIINVGSLVGITGQEGATTYCASKGAISAFTKALAIDEARHGVRVNAVLPGNILTDSRAKFVASSPNAEALDQWADSLQPLGRSGTIEEVGQVCLFLAGDAASFLTGTEIVISGGAELGYGIKYPAKFLNQG